MGKRIMGFFYGGEKNKQKIEEYKDYSKQSSVNESKVVECSGCGAKNLIISNAECEYCGSPLAYITDGKTVPSVAAASDLSDIEKTYILTTGYYTAGIDIPIGTCNVTAVSGNGNLYSSDDEIIMMFGIDRGYVSSFKGVKLPKGVSLKVSGLLTIKIVYKLIQEGYSGRTYNTSGAIELTPGNYVSGADFEAGIYNIVAVSGMGNIMSDDADINEVFGIEDEYNEIKNVNLYEDADLSLQGDMLVKLISAV
jgi:ribosomal protein S27E